MCSICRMTPCHPRCPNAPDPKRVYTCTECGYGIFEGDEYFEGPKGPICKDCIEDMDTETLLAIVGEAYSIA